MTYLAIVKVNGSGRVEKYQEYQTEAEAEAHVARVVDTYPLSYSVLSPGGYFADWLCNVVAKTVVLDPLPVVKPTVISYETFQDRFTAAEFKALTAFVVQRAADGTKPEYMQAILMRKSVNLLGAATIAFMDALVAAIPQVVTQARRDNILTP